MLGSGSLHMGYAGPPNPKDYAMTKYWQNLNGQTIKDTLKNKKKMWQRQQNSSTFTQMFLIFCMGGNTLCLRLSHTCFSSEVRQISKSGPGSQIGA